MGYQKYRQDTPSPFFGTGPDQSCHITGLSRKYKNSRDKNGIRDRMVHDLSRPFSTIFASASPHVRKGKSVILNVKLFQ